MALTPLQVRDVCYASTGRLESTMCKYLTDEYLNGRHIYLCMKKAPSVIERRKKNNSYLAKNWHKMPDNCQGYLYMKYLEQGYDVP